MVLRVEVLTQAVDLRVEGEQLVHARHCSYPQVFLLDLQTEKLANLVHFVVEIVQHLFELGLGHLLGSGLDWRRFNVLLFLHRFLYWAFWGCCAFAKLNTSCVWFELVQNQEFIRRHKLAQGV